jgi:hypothetical protein
MAEKLKLRAEDEEDVQVLSACLQDALVAVGDMRFLNDERRFVLVANRFCWEDENIDDLPAMVDEETEEDPPYERVHCGVRFENITGVKVRGFDPRDSSRILELLAITSEVAAERSAVRLIFAGDAEILLRSERIFCLREDLDEHWPTAFRPKHPVAPPEQNG